MIWIIGAGLIGQEYAKILSALGKEFVIIGRGEASAVKCEEATGHAVVRGGIEAYLLTEPEAASKAIVAVRTPELAKVTTVLLNYGVKSVLCEKPGSRTPDELDDVLITMKAKNASVFLAYNRRFFSSTLKAEEIIKEDGGVTSFNFEFTEWPDRIVATGYDDGILNNWFFCNSTHVVDLAFFLGGSPVDMKCYTANKIAWHDPSAFAGAGITDKGSLFSYQANWNAPGRWAVELLTSRHRIYLKPMEQLQLQDISTVKVYPVEIDDHLDKLFKPGFYLETKAFLHNDYSRLCSLEDQVNHTENIYRRMLGIHKN